VAKVVAFVGYYSYGIYLWHAPVASGGMHVVEQITRGYLPNTCVFSIYVVMSIALGVMMTKAVEAPVLRWRDRFFPARGSTT
jgi:peptidoglycan/LPS O-acetylase OafA/YrhL